VRFRRSENCLAGQKPDTLLFTPKKLVVVDVHLPKIDKHHETTIDFDPLYESYCILNSAGEFQHGLLLK